MVDQVANRRREETTAFRDPTRTRQVYFNNSAGPPAGGALVFDLSKRIV